MSNWYIRNRGRKLGPFTREEVVEMRASGQVQGYHECSQDGRAWFPVDEQHEFATQNGPRRKPRGADLAPTNPGPASPIPFAEPRKNTRFRLVVGAAISAVAVGGLALAYLILRNGGGANGDGFVSTRHETISLEGKSETERTHLFEKTVCFIVPGQVVTTQKGEVLEGYLLPTKVERNGDMSLSGGTGTGFVISKNGYIVTNRHVIRNCSQYRKSQLISDYQSARELKSVSPQVWVFFGIDDKFPATIEYESPDHDFALLKIDAARQTSFALCDTAPDAIPLLTNLKAVGFPGKDSEPLDLVGRVNQAIRANEGKKSDFLFQAVQRTFPVEQFKVSSRSGELNKRSELKQMREFEKESWVLRHNAQIYPGNSGGPLVGKDGTVIGINSWKHDEANIGFALTLPQLRKVIDSQVAGVVWRTHPE